MSGGVRVSPRGGRRGGPRVVGVPARRRWPRRPGGGAPWPRALPVPCLSQGVPRACRGSPLATRSPWSPPIWACRPGRRGPAARARRARRSRPQVRSPCLIARVHPAAPPPGLGAVRPWGGSWRASAGGGGSTRSTRPGGLRSPPGRWRPGGRTRGSRFPARSIPPPAPGGSALRVGPTAPATDHRAGATHPAHPPEGQPDAR